MVPALGNVVFRVRLRRDLDEEFGPFCVVDDDDDVVVSGSRATETRCKRGDECATLLLLFGGGGGEEAGMFVRSSSPFAFYYDAC